MIKSTLVANANVRPAFASSRVHPHFHAAGTWALLRNTPLQSPRANIRLSCRALVQGKEVVSMRDNEMFLGQDQIQGVQTQASHLLLSSCSAFR